jgi:hypothetical protein
MSLAKIQFSEEESELVQKADLILTKNRIIGKVFGLFGQLAEEMEKESLSRGLAGSEWNHRSKISKGENFKGLPYVVLDFPREFTKDDILAIRTLFWWGNYFSTTLQIKGRYKARYAENLKKNLIRLNGKDFYFSISSNEWAHQVNEEHYVRLDDLEKSKIEEMVMERTFLKVVLKTSLSEWPAAGELLWNNFLLLVNMLAD